MSNLQSIANSVVQALETAWNRADGAAFGAPFTEDAHFVDIRGDYHRHRAAIAAGHQAIFDSIYRGSVLSMKVVNVAPLGDDHALVHVAASMNAPTGPLAGDSRATASLVLRREGSDWHVHSFHNTLVMKR